MIGMTKGKERLVSIPKSDLDSLEATVETLENQYVMKQLAESEQDIVRGKVRKARDFIKDLQ
jgi:PHD/YefM family antitoxin component YafN of YafNO toxin-antitoxin module